MKHLLERWAILEPTLCRQDIDTDKFDYSEIIYCIKSIPVYSTQYPENYYPDKDTSLARIQWAVQQAIIEKGWYFEMYYTPSTYNEAIVIVPSKTKDKAYSQSSMAESLLTAYLKVIEDATTKKP